MDIDLFQIIDLLCPISGNIRVAKRRAAEERQKYREKT